MALTLPIIILLSGTLYLFIHKDGMKFFHALVAMVLGFELSTTIFAGQISSAVHATGHLIGSVFSF
ncbi:hypothetical protein KDL01_27615 [Actinospica durhamensis]|jgi:hypothetical protein|uniref:Uncharacterized protein n=1 Tax=Actinospica durhamensis TaxID=1508375 RepID=A0A941ETL6_9ACTN|nr:hypothetical protein [Actinospica durhamensis]MBR7837076.1 hypothetical protein [Actinospica durhamensis]